MIDTATIPQPANNAMTIQELRIESGRKDNAFRMAWHRSGLKAFDQRRQATAQEARIIREYFAKLDAGVRRTEPISSSVPPRTDTPRTATPARQRTARQWKRPRLNAELFDFVIWAEVLLGFYSLTALFGVPGFLAGGIVCFFFERSRQIMRKAPRTTESAPGSTEYNATVEYNDALDSAKRFAFATVAVIALTFMWCNGQTFYTAIAPHSDLASRIVFSQYTLADVAARWLALLMSGIAYLSLRGLSLTNTLKALQ